MSTCTRLEKWRAEAGLTYAQLAERLEVSEAQASRICRTPGDANFRRISLKAGELLEQISGGLLHAGNAHKLALAPEPCAACPRVPGQCGPGLGCARRDAGEVCSTDNFSTERRGPLGVGVPAAKSGGAQRESYKK